MSSRRPPQLACIADELKKFWPPGPSSAGGTTRPTRWARSPSRLLCRRSPAPASSPLLRALDLAGAKQPISVIQDEAFGVLHQAITVSLQLAGNPIACAAGQRGAKASVERAAWRCG